MADGEAGNGRSGENDTFKWSKEHTENFIRLRTEHENMFTGAKNSASVAWRTILEKMGLQEKVTTPQAKKKWDNLKKKYKDCKKCPGSWPWFDLMDELLRQRPSVAPPVAPLFLIASIPEDTPGPSAAVGDQEEEEEEEEDESRPMPAAAAGRKRRRDREDELLHLLKEDMRFQRETEERRAQESRERMDRLFSLLERFVDK
ncbi:uncharacterized protein LOC133457907 [Cololabis saira]|uniref:uncharacterized protein LOC133457907 n=1 Tax=Cololabis saira TaxID=129043 RepID=UPI002AD3284C|nr:uncharacterized protein LOC133457907 [Cololabis saira]